MNIRSTEERLEWELYISMSAAFLLRKARPLAAWWAIFKLRLSLWIFKLRFLNLIDTKIAISCNIAACSPYMNQRFGETYHFHLQGRKSAEQETSILAGG
jgi:hypothetical protein